jgi:hypothetical protein
MPYYQPVGTYPNDINAVTCTVHEANLGNYTSTSLNNLNKKLSILVSKELEDRGIKAGYSKPWGLGAGGPG